MLTAEAAVGTQPSTAALSSSSDAWASAHLGHMAVAQPHRLTVGPGAQASSPQRPLIRSSAESVGGNISSLSLSAGAPGLH